MQNSVPASVFKPKPTGIEKKSDATTRAAQQIIDAETAARQAKTDRLRLARLAQEQQTPANAPTKRKGGKRQEPA